MDSFQQNVLLCYRGRYRPQVASLAAGDLEVEAIHRESR
jgi:hypothetical protein